VRACIAYEPVSVFFHMVHQVRVKSRFFFKFFFALAGRRRQSAMSDDESDAPPTRTRRSSGAAPKATEVPARSARRVVSRKIVAESENDEEAEEDDEEARPKASSSSRTKRSKRTKECVFVCVRRRLTCFGSAKAMTTLSTMPRWKMTTCRAAANPRLASDSGALVVGRRRTHSAPEQR